MDHVKLFMASGMARIGVGVGVAGIISYRCFLELFRKEETWIDTDFPPDTVVLHHWPRSAYCPSLSPFVTKQETYFRVAKIPYVFIIEFLNKKFGVDLDRSLNNEERGVSRALLKLTEECLYWYLALQRWVYKSNLNWFTDHDLPNFLVRLLTEVVLTQARGQGMGRHCEEEVYHIMEDDMTALSSVLGKKKFFFGSTPTEVDCAIFGLLSQLKYNLYGSRAEKLVTEKLTNLADYCERVKDLTWPDWNACTLKGTRKTV